MEWLDIKFCNVDRRAWMMYPTQRLDVLQHRHDHIDYFSRSEQEVSQENAAQTLTDDVELTERTARLLFGC